MDHSLMNEASRKFDMILAGALARLDKLDVKSGVKLAPKPKIERPIMPPMKTW